MDRSSAYPKQDEKGSKGRYKSKKWPRTQENREVARPMGGESGKIDLDLFSIK